MNKIESLFTALIMDFAAASAFGQAPAISSLQQNGLLACTNLQPGSTASVVWASSVLGPWSNTLAGLEAVTVDSNGAIGVNLPKSNWSSGRMFYRVRGVGWSRNQAPFDMALIPSGNFTMGDTFTEGYNDERPQHTNYISLFYMDKYQVTKALWDEVKTMLIRLVPNGNFSHRQLRAAPLVASL